MPQRWPPTLPGVHILMLSDVYFPRVNGVSTSIRTCARDLVARGHSVTLVAPSYGATEDDRNEGFAIERVASRVIFFDPEDRLMRARPLRALRARLACHRFDLIHIHTPFRAHALGVALGRQLGCPTVETYHTYFEQYVAHYLPWLPGGLLRWAARRASRVLCDAVDHLIVPSDEMARVLARYGVATPATVIPTGIDLREFAGGDAARFRTRHGIDPTRPTIVTVSRLAREKRIDFLLDVTALLVARFPSLLFIVAGEGPDGARLRARATARGLAANVHFVGNLDRRGELLDCYRAGDVFVFASPTETQGLVLIEAMALGVPIVSTAVMGTATVLAHAASARVAADGVESFAGSVLALLESPQERARLSAIGPADAARWSTDSLMSRTIALYESLRNRCDAPPSTVAARS